jgi:hypothetical protein
MFNIFSQRRNESDNIIHAIFAAIDEDLPHGLDENEIDSLLTTEINPGEEQCSICLDGFSERNDACRLECNHLFHRTCIKRWMGQHVSCPVCRRSYSSAPQHNNQRRVNVIIPYTVVLNFMYPNNSAMETRWTSENTIIDIFIHLRHQIEETRKIYLYFDNITFSTIESFDHLNQSLRNFRITDQNVMIRIV